METDGRQSYRLVAPERMIAALGGKRRARA
jgi:hypothetical protein